MHTKLLRLEWISHQGLMSSVTQNRKLPDLGHVKSVCKVRLRLAYLKFWLDCKVVGGGSLTKIQRLSLGLLLDYAVGHVSRTQCNRHTAYMGEVVIKQ